MLESSIDSRMHDTPANYNLANQRMDTFDDDLLDSIQEDKSLQPAQSMVDEELISPRPPKMKAKKIRKRVKMNTIMAEFLKPT